MRPNPNNTWRCTAPRWKAEAEAVARAALKRMVYRYDGAMRERAEAASDALLAQLKRKRRRRAS